MAEQLLQIDESGNSRLTAAGEFAAYRRAFEQLLTAFLKRISAFDEATRKKKFQNLRSFIATEIKGPDDFLDTLPRFAGIIGVKPEILKKFTGAHYLNLLEKAKTNIQIEELEKIKVLNDPNRTVSDELFVRLGGPVVPLGERVFNPDGTRVDPETAPAGLPGMPAPGASTPGQPAASPEAARPPPGEELIEYLGEAISQFGPVEVSMSKPAEQAAGGPIPPPTAAPGPEQAGEPPSSELIKNVGESLAPPGQPGALEAWEAAQSPKSDSAGGATKSTGPVPDKVDTNLIQNQIERLNKKQEINLKTYQTALEKLGVFQQKKDSAGYQQWLKSEATPEMRALLKIRSALVRQSKQEVVDWAGLFQDLYGETGLQEATLTTIREEIPLFDKGRNLMRRMQKRVIDFCQKSNMDARPHLRKIQPVIVDFFDAKDSIGGKKRALKLGLMQVGDSRVRGVIEKACHQELPYIKQLYKLDD